jgi:hypothetical protein
MKGLPVLIGTCFLIKGLAIFQLFGTTVVRIPFISWCLSAISEAILLYTTFAVAPMPPAVEKTRGENDPCSTSLILSS